MSLFAGEDLWILPFAFRIEREGVMILDK